MMELLFPFLIAAAFSATFTKITLAFHGDHHWLLRRPSADRWHQRATPSLGGISMFAAFVLSVFWLGSIPLDLQKVIGCGALIFLLGLVDDLRPLPPYAKLIGQIAVACLLIVMGVHVAFTGNPLFYIPITLLWVVGMTNAFNLLDNMDGLAAGTALIATFFIGALMVQHGENLPLPAIAIFMGALFGFLLFNLSPAKIFMGDCGSQWIGFTVAALTVVDTWKSASNVFLTILTPLLLLAVPIFDTALVTFNRKVHGKPVSQGGRDHSSHRLVALGLTERQTVVVFWGLSIVFGLAALFMQIYRMETWTLLLFGIVIFILVFGLFLTEAKVYGDLPRPAQSAKSPPFSLFYKRRLVEIVADTLSIAFSYSVAYLLRYDWSLSPYLLSQIGKTLPVVVAIKLLVFLAFGLYGGLWSYIDFEGLRRLVRSSVFATAATILVILALFRFEGFSRTLFAIDWIVLFFFMAGSRALLRAMRESVFAFPEAGARLLIVGAGDTTRFLLGEIRRHREWNLRPIAIVDEDPLTHGKTLLGVPIVGGDREIASLVRERQIDRIVIAVPISKRRHRNRIEESCREAGVPHVVLESLEETLVRRFEEAPPLTH